MIEVWKKIGEPTVLAKKFGRSLTLQAYENPVTGQSEEYSLVGLKDWSVVLALTSDRRVLTVRQFKQGCDQVIDELPAGTADSSSDTPEIVMARELFEETGYKAGKVTTLGSYWVASRGCKSRFHCFLATDCVKDNTKKARVDTSEIIESDAIPLEQWLDQVFSEPQKYISEPSAVVATARAIFYLGGKIVFAS